MNKILVVEDDRNLLETIKYNLIKEGYDKKLTSMQAIGYKEVAEHLHGKYTLDELINILKQNTRNFAKRQMTWFRSFEDFAWVTVPPRTPTSRIAESVLEELATQEDA